jgi:hypothetical protein
MLIRTAVIIPLLILTSGCYVGYYDRWYPSMPSVEVQVPSPRPVMVRPYVAAPGTIVAGTGRCCRPAGYSAPAGPPLGRDLRMGRRTLGHFLRIRARAGLRFRPGLLVAFPICRLGIRRTFALVRPLLGSRSLVLDAPPRARPRLHRCRQPLESRQSVAAQPPRRLDNLAGARAPPPFRTASPPRAGQFRAPSNRRAAGRGPARHPAAGFTSLSIASRRQLCPQRGQKRRRAVRRQYFQETLMRGMRLPDV